MACVHLNQLYQLCKESQVRLSSTDLIHIVCKQCEKEEVCPSMLFEEYEDHESSDTEEMGSSPISPPPATSEKVD